MVNMFSGDRKKRVVLLLFCAGIFLLLLGGIPSHERTGSGVKATPAVYGSAFPTQIKMELIVEAPVRATIIVGQWNQTYGSNLSADAQISVDEANQTFWVSSLKNISSLDAALAYNLSYLTLVVSDPNGTGYVQMINPGTVTITSSDKWSYSPIGTITGYLYTGEYFMIEPAQYQVGLFGLPSNPFPPFPVITYNLYLFHITVPNILALPHWLYEIVIWAFNEFIILIEIGWEDVIEIPVSYIGSAIRDVASFYDDAWAVVYNAMAALPDGLGIFALPVAALSFGVLLVITVAGFALLGEAVIKLVTG